MMLITSRTPPDVAMAKIRAAQRTKELAFFNRLTAMVQKVERRGLGKARIVRALSLLAKGLDKAGGK